MWRQTDDRKVWYEWIVEVFVDCPAADEIINSASAPSPSPIPTPNYPHGAAEGKGKDMQRDEGMGRGRKTRMLRIAASELHSSVKEACLM
jgi:type II protein arginine methyltransferase